MIERYVFIKLADEHATDAGRAEVAERLAGLDSVPGVESLTVGKPADQGAAVWDVSLTLRFRDLRAVAAYVSDPAHRALVDDFLLPRTAVIKAWNFEV